MRNYYTPESRFEESWFKEEQSQLRDDALLKLLIPVFGDDFKQSYENFKARHARRPWITEPFDHFCNDILEKQYYREHTDYMRGNRGAGRLEMLICAVNNEMKTLLQKPLIAACTIRGMARLCLEIQNLRPRPEIYCCAVETLVPKIEAIHPWFVQGMLYQYAEWLNWWTDPFVNSDARNEDNTLKETLERLNKVIISLAKVSSLPNNIQPSKSPDRSNAEWRFGGMLFDISAKLTARALDYNYYYPDDTVEFLGMEKERPNPAPIERYHHFLNHQASEHTIGVFHLILGSHTQNDPPWVNNHKLFFDLYDLAEQNLGSNVNDFFDYLYGAPSGWLSVELLENYLTILKEKKWKTFGEFIECCSIYYSLGPAVCKLGEGTGGSTWMVKHEATGNYYALKVLSKKAPQEVTTLAKITNPLDLENVVRYFLGTEKAYKRHVIGGSPAVLMEYVEGRTLQQIIDEGPVKENNVLYYFFQALNGIECLRKYGIHHRDLKPKNVMVNDNGILKIVDFGSATDEENPKVRGDKVYRVSEEWDAPPSDLFSLGLIGYQLFTGKHLVDERREGEASTDFGNRIGELMKMVRDKTGGVAELYRQRIEKVDWNHTGLERGVIACLKKDSTVEDVWDAFLPPKWPADRKKAVEQLKRDWRHYKHQFGISTEELEPVPSKPEGMLNG